MSNKITLPKHKVTTVAANDAIVDNNTNIRFQSGQVIHGLKIEQGTYDTATMMTEIREAGQIHTPISLSKRADGLLYVLIGNRRAMAAQMLCALSETSEELRKALQKIPAFVYEGLTREQEQFLVNDQTSKRFKKSELVQFIWRLHDEGWDYNRIVLQYWHQLADLTNSGDKRAEVERMDNDKERIAAIKTWFRTSIEYGVLLANVLGEQVKRVFLREYLIKDGLIKESADKEGVFKIKPERLKDLKKVRDAEAEIWNPETGSPEFNAMILKFIAEDEASIGSGKDKVKRPNNDALLSRIVNSRSQVAKKALKYALGDDVPDLGAFDATAFRNEQVMEAIAKVVQEIKSPEIGNLLRQIVFNKDLPELEATLKSFC